MGIMASNSYLFSFSTGTIFGAMSLYYILRQRNWLQVDGIPQEEKYEFADPKDEYRLILAIRNDLKMQKGKVAAQCGHASVGAYAKALKSKPQTVKRWLKFGGTKITVKIESEEELLDLNDKAKELDVLSCIVRDAGQTQVAPGTRTVLAIGPAPKSVLDKITGHLKLY